MFNLYYNSTFSEHIQAMALKLGMTVDLCMAYMLMLVSTTLTLMQGYSGSAEETIQLLNYLDKAASNEHILYLLQR